MTADQINFTPDEFKIAGQHLVTVAAQEARRDALTIVPDLRRRPQPGRGNALVSA